MTPESLIITIAKTELPCCLWKLAHPREEKGHRETVGPEKPPELIVRLGFAPGSRHSDAQTRTVSHEAPTFMPSSFQRATRQLLSPPPPKPHFSGAVKLHPKGRQSGLPIWFPDSMEKTLMGGKTEGRR